MTDRMRSLEEIRRLELDVAQRLAAAGERASAAVAEARRDAARSVEDARARGYEMARRRYDTAVADARDEAERVARDGEARARQLSVDASPYLAAAAESMVELLLAPPLEEGK